MIDDFSTILPSTVKDSKGRVISYRVELSSAGGVFRANVQKTRDGIKYGAARGAKKFDNQASATEWAWKTARERLAKLSA